jgi:uncharacterized repeat protein (TIGR03803 family)
LPVAAFGALRATGRAQVGVSSAPTSSGQITAAAVKTNGCRNFNASWHQCASGEILTDTTEVKAILEGSRYTPEGAGPALYVWNSQTCPWSKAFFEDRARFGGVQFRYNAIPNNRDNRDQYVRATVSRSLPDFLSYMDRTLRVPPGPDPMRDSALNDLAYRFNRLKKLMAENGLGDLTTPSFFWIGSGKVFWATGYSPERMAEIVASVKASAAGTQETAGSAAAGEITAAAAELKTLLEGGRFTADGSGPALYAFVSQTSSPSKEFFKDRAQVNGVQFRYYPMNLKTDNPDQVVQAMQSRSVPDFLSYMNQALRAPPLRQDNTRVGIWNDFVRTTQRLDEILTQNDDVDISQLRELRHAGSPWWFWIANGKVYWTFGYTPEYLNEIVASVRSSSSSGGSQAAPPAPPRAASSPANPSPPSGPAPPAPQEPGSLRVLYVFTGGADGGSPWSDLIFDTHGNLYGINKEGGASGGSGTVFRLSPGPNGKWSNTVLHTFHYDQKDGVEPTARLVLDKAGNLWGTTSHGGTNGQGTVFELTPGPNDVWSETVFSLYGWPESDLIFDAAGNIYGTVPQTTPNAPGYGSVFRLARAPNGAWSETNIYNFGFTSNNGALPCAGLIFDAAGSLYGTTMVGGDQAGDGTVFKLTRGPGGVWAQTVLHRFDRNAGDGYAPHAALTFDAAGNLYGTTEHGGAYEMGVGGTVFKLAPGANGTWKETILHSFNLRSKDGAAPHARVILDKAGNLYGTTAGGGMYLVGTVFKLTPNASGEWTETVLHHFGRTEAAGPMSGLVFDAQGNLYGTANGGGGGLGGAVFEILAGSGPAFSSNTQPAPPSPTEDRSASRR